MQKERRNWTVAQKLAILREADADGVAKTCRKHQLAGSMIGKWRTKKDQFGEAGLESYSQRESPEFHLVADENRRLKQIVGDQALELQMLRELAKKKDARLMTSAR